MYEIENEDVDLQIEDAASFFAYELSDAALEASAGSVLMSGSSNSGVNCTGGCRK